MDDPPTKASDDLVTLTPDAAEHLEHRIAGWQHVVHALRVIARRPYLSPEQAAMIEAEADELLEKDIEPLLATLRDVPMSEILQATVEELGKTGDELL
jgi:hypothetical protein